MANEPAFSVPEDIEAIFFDVSGALMVRVADPKLQNEVVEQITSLLRTQEPPEVFYQRMVERYEAYRQWVRKTMTPATNVELWTRWMLPDWPSHRVEALAETLTFVWRKRHGRRVLRPDTQEVIAELSKRGYCLGVISNTSSAKDVRQDINDYGLSKYFRTVVSSSTFGRRKPDPEIFIEATRRAGVSPKQSAYVGDQPIGDVVGPRRAGFAMAIVIHGLDSPTEEQAEPFPQPDATIDELSELLNIFLPRPGFRAR